MRNLVYSLCLTLLGCFAQAGASIHYGVQTPAGIRDTLASGPSPAEPPMSGGDLRLVSYGPTSLPPASFVPSPGSPAPAVAIQLSEASISPTFASPQGYSSYIDDTINYGKAQIVQGTTYRPTNSTGLWDIVFGETPVQPSAQKPANFNPHAIQNATTAAISAIRANPFSQDAYALLLQARYEAMVPLTYAGNEYRALADKKRADTVGSLTQRYNQRIEYLETAEDRYEKACRQFLAMINDPDESRFFWQGADFVGDARPNWATYQIFEVEPGVFRRTPASQIWSTLLLDAYAQAVELLAEVQFSILNARYLYEYRTVDVGTNQTAINALIPECIDAADKIDFLLVPAMAAARRYGVEQDLENFGYSPQAAMLRRLATVIEQRALFFGTSQDKAGNNRINFSTYGPYDLPFLIPAQLQNRPFTFDNIVSFLFGLVNNGVPPGGAGSSAQSGSMIKTSMEEDALVANLVDETDSLVENFANLRNDARKAYEDQLIELCGGRRASNGDLVPDIVGCFLPPDERPAPVAGLLESDGAIGAAWLKLQTAETRLDLAHRALDEIADEAAIIEELGAEKIESYRRIIDIQLDTGEKISALDYQAGAIRASTIQSVAKEEQARAKRRGWFSGIGKALGKAAFRGIAAMVTGGASEIIAQAKDAWLMVKTASGVISTTNKLVMTARKGMDGLGSEIASDVAGGAMSVADGYMEAQSIGKIATIRADEATQLAHIDAQRTKIRAMEAAEITREQLTQQEILIRERVRILMIRVERQQLEKLLAEQQVSLSEMELANLVGRIGYLMQEYYKASTRIETSVKNRPDVRLRRDHKIREAESVFRSAQEYAYLAARAAFYRFYMTSSPTSTSERSFVASIRSATTDILRAQNGTDLQTALQSLLQARTDFLAATNGLTNLGHVQISVRDHLVQNNDKYVNDFRNPNGTMQLGAPLETLLQPFPIGILGSQPPPNPSLDQLSLAHFRSYLSDPERLVPLDSGSKILRIPFSLNFAPETDKMANPVRAATAGTFGHVIWGPGAAIDSNGVGVFVNLRGVPNTTGNRVNQTVLRAAGAVNMLARPPVSSTSVLPLNQFRQFSSFNLNASSQISTLYSQDVSNPLQWGTIPGINMNWGNQLHERSPANDLWILEITATNTAWNNIINNITDIEICMTILGWRHSN